MAIGSVAAARFQSAYQQATPAISAHQHARQSQSLATVGAAASSLPAPANASDKIGRKLDLIA